MIIDYNFYYYFQLFWRERVNVDLHIYLYPPFDIVEIVAFNSDLHVEATRLYCCKRKLITHLETSEIDRKVKFNENIILH